MSSQSTASDREPVGQFSLWIGMLGGATAWAIHLVVAYALVPLACARGLDILLYATIPTTIGLAGVSVWLAWRGWDRSNGDVDHDDRDEFLTLNRVRFMAISGILMSGFFLIVIIAQSVPILAYSPCDPAGSIRI